MKTQDPEINDATVLVVDDIAANRSLLRDTLEPDGYEVLLAPDGETGVKVAQRARPDVILLDVMMPKLDGFETCRRLKECPDTRAIPVIFITAKDETRATIEGFQAGGIDYIIKPFLPVNCSAVPGELAESLLFGHVRGAFSGAAADKTGYFANAHEGTLFLDEIGDMSMPLQSKLLRVIETGRILPLGAAREKSIDVRVIAATNADLQAEIGAGRFRQDLFFRLARFVVNLPSLRERREDIAPLSEHFAGVLAREMSLRCPRFTDGALALLNDYEYPGNIRERRNLVERALIESGGMEIEPEHLQFVFPPIGFVMGTASVGADATLVQSGETRSATPRNEEEERIISHVREHGGINNSECRELLSVGIHRAWYLLRKLHRSGVLRQDSSRRWAQYRLP